MRYLLVFLIPFLSIAQDSETFTRDKEFYLRGNTVVLGNNILSKDPEKPFNDLDKVNDEFKMRYVDIDDDAATWSSSSAFLNLKEGVSITYAGLYWSGTYYGERSGKRVDDGKVYHKLLDEREHDVRQVKIKLPGRTYENIQGTLIYDGEEASNISIKARAPYACMADVTAYFNQPTSGQFTVANVSATQGAILGGSSAGWLLYLVYEDQNEPLQYIATFKGFEFVNKKPVEIDFGNFQSSENGEIETAVTIGALEGDGNLGRDEIGIFDPQTKMFVTLDNDVRSSSNFFNSTITINDKRSTNRVPNSVNTLGFDLAKIKIPTAQNKSIANSTGGVKMRFKTRSDRFFLFFTAFQTTISDTFYQERKQSLRKKIVEDIVDTDTKETPIENESAANTQVKIATIDTSKLETPVMTKEVNSELSKLVEKPSVQVGDVNAGYYIITNVFSSKKNAENWTKTLASRGMEARLFKRPDTGYFYVYVASGKNPATLYKKLETIRKQADLKESWMLKINMD